MPVLTITIAQPMTEFSNPTVLRKGIVAIDDVLTATISLAAIGSRRSKHGKLILTERSKLILRPTPITSSVIDDGFTNDVSTALSLIATSCTAIALETIPGNDPKRKHLASINRALARTNYECSISFGRREFTLRGLGLASHANTDTPWEGDIVMVPEAWETGPRLVRGRGLEGKKIVMDLARTPEDYSRLMSEEPASIQFRGRGFQNKRVLRVIPETRPESVKPAKALGEIDFPEAENAR